MHRTTGQLGFADAVVQFSGSGRLGRLAAISALIDWPALIRNGFFSRHSPSAI